MSLLEEAAVEARLLHASVAAEVGLKKSAVQAVIAEEEEIAATYKQALTTMQEQSKRRQALLAEQDVFKAQIAASATKVSKREECFANLQQDIADIRKHLESRAEISKASEAVQKEIQEGTIQVEAPPPAQTPPKRRGGGKKKR